MGSRTKRGHYPTAEDFHLVFGRQWLSALPPSIFCAFFQGVRNVIATHGAVWIYGPMAQEPLDVLGQRGEKSLESKWYRGGLCGHVACLPAQGGEVENFAHTFHVRTGHGDPAHPDVDLLADSKPRRRIHHKTHPVDVEVRSVAVAQAEVSNHGCRRRGAAFVCGARRMHATQL